ncbi:MAG TPA: Ada metal-binding domain-containing protein, partial [Methanothrix sp.]|nr:Ada metal-binding domain-containing protein [Methanothrix sp.]
KEDERDEDGIEDNGGGGYELNANDVGKESLQEPSHSESSSIALFLGYPARGDEDEISSHEAILVASKSSKKYHRPDCRFAQKIKPENLISFSSFEDARREGYLPCKVCNP